MKSGLKLSSVGIECKYDHYHHHHWKIGKTKRKKMQKPLPTEIKKNKHKNYVDRGKI